jgi:hypothetical protein
VRDGSADVFQRQLWIRLHQLFGGHAFREAIQDQRNPDARPANTWIAETDRGSTEILLSSSPRVMPDSS